MGNVARVRQASIRVAKVQRRIWLLQTVSWLVVAVGGVAAVAAIAGWVWRRRRAAVETDETDDVVPAGAGRTAPPNGRLNGASSGNLSG
jgi:hypothetical protein